MQLRDQSVLFFGYSTTTFFPYFFAKHLLSILIRRLEDGKGVTRKLVGSYKFYCIIGIRDFLGTRKKKRKMRRTIVKFLRVVV